MADQTAAPDFDSLVAQYGAAKAPATPAASFDELVAQHAPPPKRSDQGPMSGPGWDAYFDADSAFSQTASPAAAHILDAFGQGAKQGWGSEPVGLSPETEKALRDNGAFNDYQKGEFNSGKALNEALFRPAATLVEAGFRGLRAGTIGALAAIAETGKEAGAPRLGREAAAFGEYWMNRADIFMPSMATLARATDLKVIGAGEGGWKGTADQVSAVEEARNRLRPSQETAEQPQQPAPAAPPEMQPSAPAAAAPPDIHAVARQIDPGTFREYDALSQRKDTFSRWIDELRDSRDQAATAGIDKQIAEQQARLDGATGKKAATYRDRLETLNDQREQALDDARAKDSPDMARIRQQLQQTDYRMRDLAPDVTKAYRAAQEHMPEAAAPEATPPAAAAAPAAEAAPAPAETAAPAEAAPAPAPVAAEATAAPHVDIAADVAQKLTAAGRPAEEANAVSALYAARYDARAARLGTTAQDLYGKQPLNVEAGGRGRNGEMGRTVLKDGRATIRLMGNADASTFMHETGHQWLEELTGDAQDERATPQTKQDAQTVRDWLGNDGGAITTGQHEKFARGFERYLMEGRAPTKALAGVFGQFKDWLTKIYETVAKLRAPITDDIRDVFDRLIAKNPDRDTVVAPEREAASAVDRHTHLAETTPPEHADGVADQVRGEADEALGAKAPEVSNEIGGRGQGQAGGNPAEGARPDGDRDAGQPVAEGAGGGAGRGTVGPGGGQAAAEGGGARRGAGAGTAVAERARTEAPAGPHEPIAEPQSRLVDKAGNIRLDNLNTPADVSSVIRDTADQNGGFIGARRGVISDQQVLDLADALGMDATSVLKRNVGQAFNAEQVVQARKLLIQSAMNVRDAATKAAEGSEADLLAYATAADRHRMIQEQVAGITAEAGRALRAFRAIDGSKEAAAIGDVLRSVTGRTLFQIRRAAAKVSELDTAAKISKFERDAARTGVFDWIQSVFINALISGPFTHAGYTAAGEMFGLFRAVGETSASAVVGKFRELTGLGEAEYAHIGEMPAQLYGMARGARNGTKAAWAAIKSNQVVLPAEVNEFLAEAKGVHGSETGQSVNPRAIIPNPTVAGRTIPVGTVLESPGRMVAALHSFNWTTFYSQSVAGQAFRQAMKEKLEGEAFSSRVADLTQSPTKEMIQEGINDANSGALMQRPAYDSLMGRVSQLTNFGVKLPDVPLPGGKSIPLGTLRPLKYIDPFVQIQANIQKTAFGRGTPLALFSQAVRDDLAMKNGGVAFDRTAGKILAGTSFMVAAGSLAAQGILNPSGPSEPRQARAWTRIHGQPHGLTVGDMSYNVLRLGNLGMQMSVAADLYHAVHQIGRDDAGKIAADLVHAFSQNIIDESSMRGPADLMRAIDEHDRHGAAWIRNFASSAVPFSVGLSQLTHQIDPYSRQARTTMDAIKAKLPGVSETLFPRRDVWGEPVPSGGWMVTYRQKIVGDHTDDVLYNLGIYPTVAPRRVRGVELTDQQYDDFARISGRAAKMNVDRVVNSPGFSSMPQGVQIELIDRGVKAGREQAASLVMMQSMGTANDIVAKATKAKTEKMTGTK